MLQIEPWTAVDTGDLPVGDVERFLLGDEVVEIPDAVLEEVGTGDDLSFTVLTRNGSADLLRLRFDLAGAQVLQAHDELVPADAALHPIRSLRHEGDGLLRLTVSADPFATLLVRARTVAVAPTRMDARRPPHVRVMWDHSTFGLWDDGPGVGPFLPEEVDLPAPLRDRIEAWVARCERGRDRPAEREAIAAELRRAWPHSVVRVHHS